MFIDEKETYHLSNFPENHKRRRSFPKVRSPPVTVVRSFPAPAHPAFLHASLSLARSVRFRVRVGPVVRGQLSPLVFGFPPRFSPPRTGSASVHRLCRRGGMLRTGGVYGARSFLSYLWERNQTFRCAVCVFVLRLFLVRGYRCRIRRDGWVVFGFCKGGPGVEGVQLFGLLGEGGVADVFKCFGASVTIT